MKRRLTIKLWRQLGLTALQLGALCLSLALPALAQQPTTPAPFALNPSDPLPGTGVMSLKPAQRELLVGLMKEGGCPCDPKLTLYACIQAQSCPGATELAAYGVQRFKEGLGSEQVIEAIITKYTEDFVPPATFELSDTAFKGAANAGITIVEFADFECPHCALMAGIMKELVKAYPQDVKLHFKQFPLPMHSNALLASKATLAAQRQGGFWPMHDLVFSNQSTLSPQSFDGFAEQLGLNLERFRKDMLDPAIEQRIERDKLEGLQAGLQGTPTLFFNGKRYMGAPTLEALKQHVAKLLAKEQTEQTGAAPSPSPAVAPAPAPAHTHPAHEGHEGHSH